MFAERIVELQHRLRGTGLSARKRKRYEVELAQLLTARDAYTNLRAAAEQDERRDNTERLYLACTRSTHGGPHTCCCTCTVRVPSCTPPSARMRWPRQVM